MLLHFPLPHFQRPQEDKSQRAFHSAQQPTACEEAAAGEMFNAEHYRKTNSDRIVVSDNLLTSCGALMRSQRAGDCVGGGSAQPASRHSRTSTARLRVTSISPSSSSIIATCAYYIIIRSVRVAHALRCTIRLTSGAEDTLFAKVSDVIGRGVNIYAPGGIAHITS